MYARNELQAIFDFGKQLQYSRNPFGDNKIFLKRIIKNLMKDLISFSFYGYY